MAAYLALVQCGNFPKPCPNTAVFGLTLRFSARPVSEGIEVLKKAPDLGHYTRVLLPSLRAKQERSPSERHSSWTMLGSWMRGNEVLSAQSGECTDAGSWECTASADTPARSCLVAGTR